MKIEGYALIGDCETAALVGTVLLVNSAMGLGAHARPAEERAAA